VRLALLAVLVGIVPVARPSPLQPLTLWELVERSDLIVLADVEGVDRLALAAGAGDWSSAQARLRVAERWKGDGPAELTVPFPGNLACPAPPAFTPGRRVLAFLAREQGALVNVGLASGTRYPRTPEAVDAYRTAVREAIALQDPWPSRPSSASQRRAWQLRLISHASTRADGLPLLLQPEAVWTDEERQVLARAFVEAPPVDDALPAMLRALEPTPDPAVTTAAVSAFDTALRAPRVPPWAEEALERVRERLGSEGPPKAPLDPLQPYVPRWDNGAGLVPDRAVRVAWQQVKERFHLQPQAIAASASSAPSCDPLIDVAVAAGRRDAFEPISLLRVARSCAVAPEAVTSWFPRHQLKMVMESVRAVDSEHVERVVGPRRCELGAVLWSFREPVLVDWPEGEAYRIVRRPASGPPIVVRVARVGGTASAVLKRDKVHGEALSGKYETLVRPVSDADFEAIRRTAEAAECWKPRHSCRAELSADPGLASGEGGSWLLEGARKGEHWSVDVDDPRPGPFLDAAMAVVRAGHGESWLGSVSTTE
jgi:hypothetical protein